MFSNKELSLFQSDYFSHFSYNNGLIEVRSKNTGHWWQIYWKDMPISNMIVTRHKYTKADKYHMQCHVHRVDKVYRMITEHDKYILNFTEQLTV